MPKVKKKTTTLVALGIGALAAVGIAIAAKPKIKVSITANPVTGPAPLDVFFTALAEGGTEPYTYDWDFGDGTFISNVQNANPTYLTAGSYTAKVIVTDAKGKTGSKSILIVVSSIVGYSVSISGININEV